MVAVVKVAKAATPTETNDIKPAADRYARGWHCLGLAADYRDGKPHSMNMFGTRVVVFQGQDGALHALNAWCPHMGADLGLGRIEGNTVVCRFHEWGFGTDGGCKHIPYAKHIPPKARVKAWPTLEENKLLFVWHDAEGGAPDPGLAVPRLPQVFSDQWSEWSMLHWKIDNNCRELVDNLADLAHFGPVHGSSSVAYFANIFEGPKATQVMVGTNERLGGARNHLTTVATYFGPACLLCSMSGEADGMPIESILFVSHVPINQTSFDLRYGVLVKKIPGLSEEQNQAVIKNYVDLAVKAFSEDVEIWHNKVRVDMPLLCDGDGPIYQLRQWYGQFYKDVDDVPVELGKRRVIEIDHGIGTKPPLQHVFGL
ncbi:MAG: Rieske 2Fe-2S domain-containing protein [Nevskia sp.]|nr:Rieske 2Fe-2S domain-containing protein [Nevskia sp.]